VPSAANELTSGVDQAQASSPGDAMGTTPGKTIPENADSMLGVAPPASPTPKVPAHAPDTKKEAPSFAAAVAAREPHVSGHGVVVDAANRVGVPSFLGEPLRLAVESASTAGLALQIVGSGIAREQVPAPGSMVPLGTEVVVRFTR
jgi:cell division protein FtsI (penicillin-binding protein 3)